MCVCVWEGKKKVLSMLPQLLLVTKKVRVEFTCVISSEK